MTTPTEVTARIVKRNLAVVAAWVTVRDHPLDPDVGRFEEYVMQEIAEERHETSQASHHGGREWK